MKVGDIYISSNIHFLEMHKTRSRAITNIEGNVVFLTEIDPTLIGEEFNVKINKVLHRTAWGEVLIEEPEDTSEDEIESDEEEATIQKDTTDKDALSKRSKLKFFEDVDESEVENLTHIANNKAIAKSPVVSAHTPARDDPFIKKYKTYLEQAIKHKAPEEILELAMEVYPDKAKLIKRYMWEEYGVGDRPPEPTPPEQSSKKTAPPPPESLDGDYDTGNQDDDEWDEDSNEDYSPDYEEGEQSTQVEDNGR